MGAKYYAMIDGERKGPYSLEELPAAGVRPSTYIWTKGLTDWQKAEDNADVCRLFRNHLYDIMHPGDSAISSENQVPVATSADDNNPWKVRPDTKADPHRSKFDGFLQQVGEDPLPTLEEIDAKQDKTLPPVSMIGYAWLVTVFCFFPTGIVALVFAYRSKKEWKSGNNALSHDYCRRSKMWTGITFFLGMIGWALFCALSL